MHRKVLIALFGSVTGRRRARVAQIEAHSPGHTSHVGAPRAFLPSFPPSPPTCHSCHQVGFDLNYCLRIGPSHGLSEGCDPTPVAVLCEMSTTVGNVDRITVNDCRQAVARNHD